MFRLIRPLGLLAVLILGFLAVMQVAPSQASVLACDRDYWVDPAGSNANPGTLAEPWATLEHAYYTVPDNSCTVWFNPGVYDAASLLLNPGGSDHRFTTTTTFKSLQPYKAVLQNPGKVLDFQGVQNMVLEGFEIKQTTPAPEPAHPMIDFHRRTSPVIFAQNITFRDNIIHDANGDDIALIKGGVQYITFEKNIFYNQGVNEQILDINSALDVTVRDNIFFNDLLVDGSNTKSFISIKDTNENVDGYLGSERIKIQRNVFLNWQGFVWAKFIQVGDGGPAYHSAKDIQIENNLMIGNSQSQIGDAIGVSGAKDVTFSNNTITGDLPASSYAMEIIIEGENPLNENIKFFNNIWSDPTGTMGTPLGGGTDDFSDGDPTSTTNLVLDNNFYYNGGESIPDGDVLSPNVDDVNRYIANPGLNTNQSGVVLPKWNGSSFTSGNATTNQEFLRLVNAYGAISGSSPASGVANPTYAPSVDILGNARPGSPSMGAYEPLGFSSSIQLTKSSNKDIAEVGDSIQYTVQIQNTSDNSSPNLVIDSITDTLQGELTNPSNTDSNTCGSVLGFNSSCTITYTYTVQSGDPDPLVNTALVQTHPQGYSFTVEDNDSKEVQIVNFGINLDKSSDVSKAVPDDDIVYTVVITNTSSPGSPNLVFDAITDSLQGDLTKPQNYDTSNCTGSLAPGVFCTITYTYTVKDSDPNPLVNTAAVETHPSGTSLNVDDSDTSSVIIGDNPGVFLPIVTK